MVLERSILHGTFEKPSRWNPSVPFDAETTCLIAMERHPRHRYESAAAFARGALRGVVARRPGLVRRTRSWIERHPVRSTILLAVLLLLVAGPWAYGEIQRRAARDVERANAALQRANDRARSTLEDLVRLSDARTLDELEEQAARLWPARPETVEAMDAWLARAHDVLRHRRAHAGALARLEADADVDAVFAHGDRAYWLETLRGLVERLRVFDDPDDGWRARIQRRREDALSLPARSTVGHEAAWREAIQAIREAHVYDGLELTPQMGLVPLGLDPGSGLWEFWHVDSGERPERDPATGRVRIAPDSGIVLVLLPGGTFRMGAQARDANAPNYDPEADMGDESPVHEVTLAPFFLARHEVTQGQWERTMGSNPSYYTGRSKYLDAERAGAHPVEQISWVMAEGMLHRLDLTLPTEAQWEYACRGGTNTIYATGNEPSTLLGYANLSDEGSKRFYVPGWAYEPHFADGFVAHAPVGMFEPNAFCLHDMHGNAWEWVRDGYVPYRVTPRAGDGLRIPRGEPAAYRIVRGGSFSRPAASARVADRDAYPPDTRDFYLGARAARAVER